MSEEAKVVYLQEKIKQVKSYERFGAIFAVLGAILVFFLYFFPFIMAEIYSYSPTPPTYPPSDSGLVLGILFIAFGVAVSIYYRVQGWRSMEQLLRMAAANPTCPHCKKELPKGNFAFCPFCGVSLK